ncbi:MAG: lytic murein transglycosylase [Pseudomonadota bacterium]
MLVPTHSHLRALLFCLVLVPGSVLAETDPPGTEPDPFQTWLAEFRREAASRGLSEATLNRALDGLQPIPKLLEYDRRQPEFLETFRDYLAKRVNDGRLAHGLAQFETHGALLREVEQRFGVPAQVLVAFWGLETNYGSYLGNTPLFAGLATLAQDTRRPAFFRQQLLDALRLVERDRVAPTDLVGSWAGALGQMQFIPSTWLAHAVDGDGDGRIDLIGSLADALHSAANYLRQAGWRPGEPWGLEVRLPEGLDLTDTGLEWQKPLSTWSLLGLARPDGAPLPAGFQPASLILPQGIEGPAFLVMSNFRVIMQWNRSVHYALSVGHLADRLAGAPALEWRTEDAPAPLSRTQMEYLQKGLSMLGYDAGPADGIPGTRTRGAIRAYQARIGLPADGYPSLPLIEHLQNTLLEQALPLPEGGLGTDPEASG